MTGPAGTPEAGTTPATSGGAPAPGVPPGMDLNQLSQMMQGMMVSRFVKAASNFAWGGTGSSCYAVLSHIIITVSAYNPDVTFTF